ncbi:HesA/MoeB/ThiF family protein [Paludibacter sp.]|uniref:HesA/MoeB/ThiF family protein n=1 Tax=Paludibacter sp. TaxID=1898105 RepID=UPI0013539168|nr:HesA/MoeB/ThiF family protein [Paludibacter sp.]MTK54050.1 HesA/MoeB/ThiF family protein [Paludibacter sp.]
MGLNAFEQEKYDRHLRINGFTPGMQEKLKRASVLVIGAGGLGCPVLQYLTAAGVGRIGIVEPDVVSVSNLQRQILYAPSDLGKSKALLAAERLQTMNPEVRIEVYNEWLTDESANRLFPGFDVVVGATDNFKSRFLIDCKSRKFGIPFVHGAIRELEGQLSVFNYRGSMSYKDMFGHAAAEATSPIGVMGAIPGVIGSMMALEVLKILTGLGEVMTDKLLLYDGMHNRIHTVKR